MPSVSGGGPGLRSSLTGLGFAAATWPWVFRGQSSFWARMSLASGVLGILGHRFGGAESPRRPAMADVVQGITSAAGLYAIFQVGDRMARSIMPAGDTDIERVYRLRHLAPRPLIVLLLAGVIAPSEELFWRGLLQHRLMERFGRARGTALSAACYGGVHLGSGNLTLTGAATVAGAYWGAEYALNPRLEPLLISHILWDLWIFLLQPTPGGREAR